MRDTLPRSLLCGQDRPGQLFQKVSLRVGGRDAVKLFRMSAMDETVAAVTADRAAHTPARPFTDAPASRYSGNKAMQTARSAVRDVLLSRRVPSERSQ